MDVVRGRVPRRIGPLMIQRRMTLTQALAASVTVTGTALLTGAAAVTRTDPEQFPHFGIGLWGQQQRSQRLGMATLSR
jgi:hypothetical protein